MNIYIPKIQIRVAMRGGCVELGSLLTEPELQPNSLRTYCYQNYI
jgi:hypothetical protein